MSIQRNLLGLFGARRTVALLAGACALGAGHLLAGEVTSDGKDRKTVQQIMDDITPLDLFDAEGSYVFGSKFHTHSVNGESQDEIQASIEYAHRFHLFDKIYLKLGGSYERFDFGTTDAPIPSSLQSIAGVVAVEYVVQGQPGIFITSKPGVYFSDIHDVSMGNFDFPTTMGGIIPLGKKVYLLVGIHTSILSHYPVFPIAGVVWLINDHLRLEAVPPDPKLIYTVNDKLDFFVGGELLGDAFKRDETNYGGRNQRFSGGVIDYGEYRVGGGLTYTPIKQIDIDLAGGWQLERSFDYYRGDSGHRNDFNTNGAPYAKIAVSAEF